MTDVFFVVPDGIDDPARPSGGNAYDRHLRHELRAQGWAVEERAVAGFWDGPDAGSFAALEAALARIPDGAVVLIDGLIASAAPGVLAPQADRLCLVVLVHMAFGHRPVDDAARERERAALATAAAIVTTSDWTRGRLVELYGLSASLIHVAEPGAPAAKPARGTGTGEELLCVGTVSFEKGHDVLLEALGSIWSLPWHCTCVGSVEANTGFVEGLRRSAADLGLEDRVSFAGVRGGVDIDCAYASADLLVVASRAETYGMVVTEALARGLPVIAAEVGGVAEALGEGNDGARPGLLVGPGDPVALGEALGAWLEDAELRTTLRRAARERRESLSSWSTTASVVAGVLAEVA